MKTQKIKKQYYQPIEIPIGSLICLMGTMNLAEIRNILQNAEETDKHIWEEAMKEALGCIAIDYPEHLSSICNIDQCGVFEFLGEEFTTQMLKKMRDAAKSTS